MQFPKWLVKIGRGITRLIESLPAGDMEQRVSQLESRCDSHISKLLADCIEEGFKEDRQRMLVLTDNVENEDMRLRERICKLEKACGVRLERLEAITRKKPVKPAKVKRTRRS